MTASSTSSGDVSMLIDGVARDEHGETHHWSSNGLPADIVLEWDEAIQLSSVEIKCDTNLRRNIMMLKVPRETEAYTAGVPRELLKSLELEVRVAGEWKQLGQLGNNTTRLIKFQFDRVEATAVRLRLKETYGAEHATLFEVRCYGE